jgi:hypothetical protein
MVRCFNAVFPSRALLLGAIACVLGGCSAAPARVVPADAVDAGEQDAGPVEESDAGDAGESMDAGPMMMPDAGDPGYPLTSATLSELELAYQAFFRAELRWPMGASYWRPDWDPTEYMPGDTLRTADVVGPSIITTADTAFFVAPNGLPDCAEMPRGVCWQGPFLHTGNSLSAAPWLDAWGHPLRYLFVAPHQVWDASSLAFVRVPTTIALWSIGGDGIDQTGCTSRTSCSLDLARIMNGEASGDDLLVLVPDESPHDQASKLLEYASAGMQLFHNDTAFWPYANSGWNAAPSFPVPELMPRSFTSADTALLTTPVANADTQGIDTLWKGSYLWTDIPNMEGLTDPWGAPLLYTYIRPDDGFGGGVSGLLAGAVIVWSTGPDRLDQTGCSTGNCTLHTDWLVQGVSSGAHADDLVVYVGPASP